MSTKDYSAPTGHSQVPVMSTLSIVVHRRAVQFFKANRRNNRNLKFFIQESPDQGGKD